MGKIFSFCQNNINSNDKLQVLIEQGIIYEIPSENNKLRTYFIKFENFPKISELLEYNLSLCTIDECHDELPLIGKLNPKDSGVTFACNSLQFSQHSFHIFAGLNAADNVVNIEKTFKFLQERQLTTARMGIYKPRTSPYSFQGLSKGCLHDVFSLADKYQIKILAAEVRSPKELSEIHEVLAKYNYKVKVLVQIGTRNAQNFELLKEIGNQNEYPILYKKGYGITLQESMLACEYLAKSGNNNIIFCLRGVKSYHAAPHRNLCDFNQISTIKRELKLPVCIDPSHAIGDSLLVDDLGISDIAHSVAQSIISGTNALLIDIHPDPKTALVDAKQALSLEEFNVLLEDIKLCRNFYQQRLTHYQEISSNVINFT